MMRCLRNGFLSLAIMLWVALLGMSAVQAQDLEKALAGFTADNFADTDSAIGAVAQTGSPLAIALIEALQDGRLLFSAQEKKVFFRDRAGAVLDAATGKPAAAVPGDLSPVRVNNRVRRAIDAALGGLTLLSPDPARRLDAARAVFKSKDANALPALVAAIQKETNPDHPAGLGRSTCRRHPVPAGCERGREDRRGRRHAPARRSGCAGAAAKPAGRHAGGRQAHGAGRDRRDPDQSRDVGAVQNVWYGLSLGSVLLLAAIGLAITFGVMGVINMAHGEMVMLGAYTTFVVQELIRAHNPALFDYSLLIAIPLAFLVAGFVGILIERGVIRFLYGRPLETLLATWGISLILQQAVRTAFGPTNKDVSNPSWMSGSFEVGYISITYNRLWIIVFTMLIFVLLLALLRFTHLGLEMRAVTQNRAMAASMGIRTSRIDALTFGLGSGIAGLAGVALSQIDNVSPNLGQGYIINSFMVVVFGGVGNLWGTLVGAFTLGIANKFLEPYAGAVLAKIAILVLIILFIQKRPRGLFALKGRAVEA